MKEILPGFIALAFNNSDKLYLSKLNRLYEYNLVSNDLREIYNFKGDSLTFISRYSKILRRLFRRDIRYGHFMDEDNLLLVKNNLIFRISLRDCQIKNCIPIPRGSRPLNMTLVKAFDGFTDGIYFGEYFSNPMKDEISIYRITEDKIDTVYKFPKGEINHVHNIILDEHRKCLWILSGDFDDSPGIYMVKEDFRNIECILKGKQIYRSCVAFPVEDGLIYATDSQFEENSVRLLCKDDQRWVSRKLTDINGPCIFGTRYRDQLCFSTSVEAINSGGYFKKMIRNKRAPGVKLNQSTIITGNLKSGFNVIYRNEKDFWPFVPFQFGNILFPSGENNTNKLIFTNIALKNDDITTIIQEMS